MIKNFWNYLFDNELMKILFIIGLVFSIMLFYVSWNVFYYTTENSIELNMRLNVILVILSLFSAPINMTVLINYGIQSKERKSRHRLLTYIYNNYNNDVTSLKKEIEKIKSLPIQENEDLNPAEPYDVMVKNIDAMEIKRLLVSIIEIAEVLKENITITTDEFKTVSVLISRSKEYLKRNPHIKDIPDGVAFWSGELVKINTKWLTDIPHIMEVNKIRFHDITIREMLDKYQY